MLISYPYMPPFVGAKKYTADDVMVEFVCLKIGGASPTTSGAGSTPTNAGPKAHAGVSWLLAGSAMVIPLLFL